MLTRCIPAWGEWPCPYCDALFSWWQMLVAHVKEAH